MDASWGGSLTRKSSSTHLGTVHYKHGMVNMAQEETDNKQCGTLVEKKRVVLRIRKTAPVKKKDAANKRDAPEVTAFKGNPFSLHCQKCFRMYHKMTLLNMQTFISVWQFDLNQEKSLGNLKQHFYSYKHQGWGVEKMTEVYSSRNSRKF